MSVEPDQREGDDNAASDSWLARLVAFIAWLFDAIARLKRVRRTTRFKPGWRDHWDRLRELEWHRHQMLAQGAALLLSGRTLNDADFVPHPMPADYGGRCPKSPFQMNRRFLLIADFLRDPKAHIRRHAQRIARRAGIALNGDPLRLAAAQRFTSPGLRPEEETHLHSPRAFSSSDAKRRGRWRATSSSRDGGGSRRLAFNSQPRAPPKIPYFRLPPAHCRAGSRQRGRTRMSAA